MQDMSVVKNRQRQQIKHALDRKSIPGNPNAVVTTSTPLIVNVVPSSVAIDVVMSVALAPTRVLEIAAGTGADPAPAAAGSRVDDAGGGRTRAPGMKRSNPMRNVPHPAPYGVQ